MSNNELFADYPDVVSLKDMRKMLGGKNKPLGRTTAYKLLQTKTIPAIKITREYRIQKADIIKFLLKK